MLFVVLHSLLLLKRCSHDEFMNGNTVIKVPTFSSNDWEHIRIKMDFRYFFESSTDKYMCRYPGQILSVKNTRILCNSSDVLSTEKRDVAIGTINNVKSFVERFISVNPRISSFQIKNYSDETSFVDEYAYGADLHITVLTRPESYVKALATSIITSMDEKLRPLTGVLILNPAAIPNLIQKETTSENGFFYLILHQMIHILGITSSLFKWYHPEGISSPHEMISYNFMKNNRNFKFLVSPNAKQYAKNHYGNQSIGIELEDTPGQESHLEMRTFFTEVMTGGNFEEIQTNKSFYRLTDATMALLQDTGNYRCDYKMVQPLIWGNKDSIDGKFIKDFAIGPPQEVFPEYYTTDGKLYAPGTLFDYKHYGKYSLKKFNCQGGDSETQYCKSKEFYNPKNFDEMYEDQNPDYMSYPIPVDSCGVGTAMIPSTLKSGTLQKCGEYNCKSDYSSFTFNLYSNSTHYKQITCNKSTAGYSNKFKYDWHRTQDTVEPRYVWCPDPERFCRTVKLYESHFTSNPYAKYF